MVQAAPQAGSGPRCPSHPAWSCPGGTAGCQRTLPPGCSAASLLTGQAPLHQITTPPRLPTPTGCPQAGGGGGRRAPGLTHAHAVGQHRVPLLQVPAGWEDGVRQRGWGKGGGPDPPAGPCTTHGLGIRGRLLLFSLSAGGQRRSPPGHVTLAGGGTPPPPKAFPSPLQEEKGRHPPAHRDILGWFWGGVWPPGNATIPQGTHLSWGRR